MQKTTHLKSKTDAKALEISVPSGGTFFPHFCGSPNKPGLANIFRLLRETAQPTHPGIAQCLKLRRGEEESVFTFSAGE